MKAACQAELSDQEDFLELLEILQNVIHIQSKEVMNMKNFILEIGRQLEVEEEVYLQAERMFYEQQWILDFFFVILYFIIPL